MASYYDKDKKEFVITGSKDRSVIRSFPEVPGILDYAKEGLETNDIRAQLEAIRRRRAKDQS